MLNNRNEFKLEKKNEKEAEVLDSFFKIWEKPFEELIKDFYENKAEDILHLRIRKGLDADKKVIAAVLKQLSEKNEDSLTSHEAILKLILFIHSECNQIDMKMHTRELQKSLTKICNQLYNQDAMEFNPELDDLQFYLVFHTASAYDPLGIHMRVDFTPISDYFDSEVLSRRKFPVNNSNCDYLLGLGEDLGKMYVISAYWGGVKFPPYYDLNSYCEDGWTHEIRQPDYFFALKHYRQAVAAGSEIALTGLARMHALGLAGLTRDPDYAIELYKLALKRDVLGAVPCDSGDPRILFYSTLASGMCSNRRGAPPRADLVGMRYIEVDWLSKKNLADVKLSANLDKFQLMALQNPKNIFDELLVTDASYLERLKLCLDEKTYDIVFRRNRKFFGENLNILNAQTQFPPGVSRIIMSFITDNKACYLDSGSSMELKI